MAPIGRNVYAPRCISCFRLESLGISNDRLKKPPKDATLHEPEQERQGESISGVGQVVGNLEWASLSSSLIT